MLFVCVSLCCSYQKVFPISSLLIRQNWIISFPFISYRLSHYIPIHVFPTLSLFPIRAFQSSIIYTFLLISLSSSTYGEWKLIRKYLFQNGCRKTILHIKPVKLLNKPFFFPVAIFLGVWMCVSISPFNILLGIWQILAGFIVLCVEAPCCCMFIDHVQKLADFMDGRPYWNRALVYVG